MADKRFYVNINALGSSISASTIYSGTTNIENLFASQASVSGFQAQLDTKANLSGATFTGNVFAPALSATTLSGGTIYSGSTDINSLFADKVHTHTISQITGLQGALDTKANLSGATFTGGVYAPTLSGGTIYSGNTDIESIFVKGSGTSGTLPVWNGTTYLGDSLISQAGTGVTVNGSVQIYGDVNILGTATTFNTQTVQSQDNNILLNFSGSHVSALYGGITVLSGKTDGSSSTWTIDTDGNWSANSGVFIYSGLTVQNGQIKSGTTDLYSIFQTVGSDTPHTTVQNGLNTYTGGTALNPTVNISAATLHSLTVSGATSLGVVSATTIYSGSTDLSSLFITAAGSGLTKTGTVFDVDINTSGLEFDGSDRIKVRNYTAVTNTIVSRSYEQTGFVFTANTTSTFTHNLGTKSVDVTVYDEAYDEQVEVNIKANNINSVDITSNVGFTARINIQG